MNNSSHSLSRRAALRALGAVGALGAGALTAQAAAARTTTAPTGPRIPKSNGSLLTPTLPGAKPLSAEEKRAMSIVNADNNVKGKVQRLGRVVDFATKAPTANALKSAGFIGAIRYVSGRRPGTEDWMYGKPVTKEEAREYTKAGLFNASVYQFRSSQDPDWKRGKTGGAEDAKLAIKFHEAAGGPKGKPIYAAIDSNPTLAEFNSAINPYLTAFAKVLETNGYKLGVYGNFYTIDWCLEDRLGEYFWQHDWGSNGKLHKYANLHQEGGNQTILNGTTVDINSIYKTDWGQWQTR